MAAWSTDVRVNTPVVFATARSGRVRALTIGEAGRMSREPTEKNMKSFLKTVVGASLLMGAVLTIGSALPANASTNLSVVSQSGAPAGVSAGNSICLTNETNPSPGYYERPLVISVGMPTINGLAGYSQSSVEFRTIVIDVTTNTVVYGPWSAWAAATPTVPAHWTGTFTLTSNAYQINYADRYVTQTEVWWYANGAFRAHVIDQERVYYDVNYFNGQYTTTTDATCHNLWFSGLTNRWYWAS